MTRQEQAQKAEWISVEDALPPSMGKDNDNVLIYTNNGNFFIGRYSAYSCMWFFGDVGDEDEIVAYWTHLPQPPILSNVGRTGKDEIEEIKK